MSDQINLSKFTKFELAEMREDQSKVIYLEPFEIARIGKDQLYEMVEEKMGYTQSIKDMKLHPIAFDEDGTYYYAEIIDATEN